MICSRISQKPAIAALFRSIFVGFGTESERLVKDGEFVRFMWKIVERYDYHWNGSLYSTPCRREMD
jgi:hypothetical protein